MQAYVYELTMRGNRVLTLDNLPFRAGEHIEVILIRRSNPQSENSRYPFWGKPLTYLDPTEPVAEEDWEALQ